MNAQSSEITNASALCEENRQLNCLCRLHGRGAATDSSCFCVEFQQVWLRKPVGTVVVEFLSAGCCAGFRVEGSSSGEAEPDAANVDGAMDSVFYGQSCDRNLSAFNVRPLICSPPRSEMEFPHRVADSEALGLNSSCEARVETKTWKWTNRYLLRALNGQ
jgi:hypothetical protein